MDFEKPDLILQIKYFHQGFINETYRQVICFN